MELNNREQKAKREAQSAKRSGIYFFYSLLLALSCLLAFHGCASVPREGAVLAVVDSEPITEADLRYSLSIAHRREDLSSAGNLNLSEYVRKLVDDRLIINEARTAGMDKYPEVQKAVKAYVLRESVVQLHEEEVVQKVSVTEKDIKDYYGKNYEKFRLGLIELKSKEEAEDVSRLLLEGGDFKEFARKYSLQSLRKDNGNIVLTRKAVLPEFEKVISALQPQEVSDAVKVGDRWYIVKLLGREEPPEKEFEHAKGSLERAVRRQKEQERGDEYLNFLRERAVIKKDGELLSQIRLVCESKEMEKCKKDKRTLAEADDEVLTVGDLIKIAGPSFSQSPENIVNNWIDCKVVDHEALRRHYEKGADMKEMVRRYEDQLLKGTFIKKIIMPRIVVTDEKLREYYSKNQDSFLKPVRYKIRQITVKSMDEAREILDNLRAGADFAWVARNKSIDAAASKGGDAGWFRREELPKSFSEIADTVNIGDLSPVVKLDLSYTIFRIEEKTPKEPEAFDEVKDAVVRAYVGGEVNNLLDKYVTQLKADANIEMHDDEIRNIERRFKQ
jgi:peptidyl-prolyl cis-trans isomerase C